MHQEAPVDHDHVTALSIRILDRLLGRQPSHDFAIRLWNGRTWRSSAKPPAFTVVVRNPCFLRRIIFSPDEYSLGKSYIQSDFDIEGEMEEAFALREFLTVKRGLWESVALVVRALRLPSVGAGMKSLPARLEGSRHSIRRDRQAIGYHYDVSNDFYRLWLDERMVYSCGYFRNDQDDLDTAQEEKLDYLCRKLRLKPGERLLDIGCGWGALVIHAASRYGVEAHGITLSEAQAVLADRRIREAGLAGRCRVELRDYRELGGNDVYDKIVSVGMFEHVGRERLPEYFSRAWQLLRPRGLFLNHGIAEGEPSAQPQGRSFIDAYVFPDGDLLPIGETIAVAGKTGFEVRDLESLREHYTLTLRHWVRRLEEGYEKALSLTDEVTCRIWRLYMAGCAYGFRTGRINIYQTLLAKSEKGDSGLPLRRDYMMGESPRSSLPAWETAAAAPGAEG